MTGLALAEVLAAHDWIAPRGYAWPCCVCGVEFPDGEDAAYAHVAAAVTAWLAERLGSEVVREAVETAITNAWHSGDSDVTAALAAVVDALAGEGNADSAPEAARNGARSDERPERDQLRQGRDDEGRSGARDGSGS